MQTSAVIHRDLEAVGFGMMCWRGLCFDQMEAAVVGPEAAGHETNYQSGLHPGSMDAAPVVPVYPLTGRDTPGALYSGGA